MESTTWLTGTATWLLTIDCYGVLSDVKEKIEPRSDRSLLFKADIVNVTKLKKNFTKDFNMLSEDQHRNY